MQFKKIALVPLVLATLSWSGNIPLHLTVTDFKGKALAGESVTIKGKDSEIQVKVDGAGKATVSLPTGDNYSFWFSSFMGAYHCKECGHLKVPADVEGEATYSLQYDNSTFNLSSVNFEFNKAVLLQESKPYLDQMAQNLNSLLFNTLVLEIAGHTDDIGDDKTNLKLSRERAAAVRDYLVSAGVAPDRLVAKGYGESQPKVRGTSEGARAANRRVEARVLRR
jgi:outer membrane protein OmpA-like peptidoglycan-associated protein